MLYLPKYIAISYFSKYAFADSFIESRSYKSIVIIYKFMYLCIFIADRSYMIYNPMIHDWQIRSIYKGKQLPHTHTKRINQNLLL